MLILDLIFSKSLTSVTIWPRRNAISKTYTYVTCIQFFDL